MSMFMRLAIAITIILALYAFIPMVWINILGYFAIGWLVMDIVDHFFKE